MPAVFLAEKVRVRRGGELAQHGAVERVVGAGREHTVAGVEQRGEAVIDDLARAKPHHDALDVPEAVGLGAGANGVERGAFAQRVAIAVEAGAHGALGGLDEVWRRREVELARVADVQIKDLMALAGDLVGGDSEVADGIADVGHPAGGRDVTAQMGGHR